MGRRTVSSDIIDNFLIVVGATGAGALSLIAPNSLLALEKPLLKLMSRKDRREAKRLAQYMKDRKLIRVLPQDDGSYLVELTDKGETRRKTAYFEKLTIPDTKWDGKWRIFMFDIPERYKLLRDFVSFHVKRAGFKQLQRSVFAYPYPIDEFMAVLLDVHPELSRYVATLTTEDINLHNTLVQQFKNIL